MTQLLKTEKNQSLKNTSTKPVKSLIDLMLGFFLLFFLLILFFNWSRDWKNRRNLKDYFTKKKKKMKTIKFLHNVRLVLISKYFYIKKDNNPVRILFQTFDVRAYLRMALYREEKLVS